MRVEFNRKFAKDLAKIGAADVLGKIKDAILALEATEELRSLGQIKVLKGGGGYLRMRVGDYRIGFQIIGHDTVLLLRVMHRGKSTEIFRRSSSPYSRRRGVAIRAVRSGGDR